jgi:hypothetical protein
VGDRSTITDKWDAFSMAEGLKQQYHSSACSSESQLTVVN